MTITPQCWIPILPLIWALADWLFQRSMNPHAPFPLSIRCIRDGQFHNGSKMMMGHCCLSTIFCIPSSVLSICSSRDCISPLAFLETSRNASPKVKFLRLFRIFIPSITTGSTSSYCSYPLPTRGMFVAMTVMFSTFADNGRDAI